MSSRAFWATRVCGRNDGAGKPVSASRAKSTKRSTKPRPGQRPIPISHQQSATNVEIGSSGEKIDSVDIGLALLGFASGIMDALAFFNLGQVFPSAMTGNTALLGLSLGQGNLLAASRPFVAFAGFLAGAAAATAGVNLWLDKLPRPRAVFWLLALEACFLGAFAWVWRSIDGPVAGAVLYGLVIIASLAMGLQSVAARMVGRSGITTVVFTSTLTAIATSAINAIYQPPHRLPFEAKRQIGMFLIYGVGAAVCGLLASHAAAVAVLPFAAVVGAAGFHRHGGRNGEGKP